MSKFANGAKIVHIDIDPSEINKNVQIDVGIIGNMHDVLNDLLPLVKPAEHNQWMDQINIWQEELDYKPEDSDEVIKPHQLFSVLEKVTDSNTIIATDVGQHQMWASQYCGRTKPRSFLTSGGLGTMGYGYGAAIGAKIGNPDSRVIHITGDGSFHMNLNELCTTVSYELPVITIVLNNSVLGMVRQWQTKFYEKRYSCTSLERKTDFVKVAEAFGGTAYRASTISEFEKALEMALENKNGPTVIDCIIDKDESVFPMIPAGKSIDDVMLA